MAKAKKGGTRSGRPAVRLRRLTSKQQKEEARKQTNSYAPVPGSFRLTRQALGIVRKFWKPLGGILLVYIVLNIFFASGLGNLSGMVDNITSNLEGSHSLNKAAGSFSGLFTSSAASGSAAGSTLEGVLVIIESLVIIWALRHLLAGKKIGIKQAYYDSSGPLIPFMIVVFVIILQLIPLAIGSLIFNSVTSVSQSGLAATISGLIFFLLGAWTVYMVSGSILALYIVTLPQMQPLAALRSSHSLVRFRRWTLLRRMLFLPLFIVAAMAVLVIPSIMIAPWLAAPVFWLLGIVALLYAHTYLYNLYRSLLA